MNSRRTTRSTTTRWATTAAAILIAGVWVASFWCQLGLRQITREGTTGTLIIDALYTSGGAVCYGSVAYVNGDSDTRVPPHKPGVELLFFPSGTQGRSWSFEWLRDESKVRISLGLPFLLAAAPTFFLWRSKIIARRRSRAGLCKKCAYSRDSLSPDAKCPECGTVPAPAAK